MRTLDLHGLDSLRKLFKLGRVRGWRDRGPGIDC